MGFITVVVLHNDAMGEFEKNPTKFGEAILDGVKRAQLSHREESVPIGSYANYIHVHPSRHADDHTLFLNKGNSVTNLNAYDLDFRDLVKRLPEVAEEFLKAAQFLLKNASHHLKINRQNENDKDKKH
jgi:hypothetical protein